MNIIYTALYRQWRPDTFKDVVGQDTIIRTLTNQLSSGHIAHAYLFCGSRGTGKTSTAKIFARAINCMTPTEYGPCGECEVCENLSSDSNMDILEIDAASNNGVDEIRDLREKVRFPPAFGKFKVYIIDEVHMLSIGAFNALLKTLEEPPSHAVFILATTEPHKLPATILSRCQRFDFKRISQKVIVGRMRNICDSMNIMVENEGLHTIARWAEGGMRDALSLLDQIIGFSGNQITNDDIINIIGTADQSFLFQTTDDILTGNLQGMLQKINQLLDEGKALNIFTRDLLQHIRNLLIV
ncbi:MAG: DNA polymerase III subunit gamma/tau, partial [Clostridia bacterium]|nr:DNA polymerase III subunit gamma/tau [Clostridia bacterium]